jgi:hypothetical protein
MALIVNWTWVFDGWTSWARLKYFAPFTLLCKKTSLNQIILAL